MSLQEYYEESFQSERSLSASEHLQLEARLGKGLATYVQECRAKFLSRTDWPEIKVLELGSGRGGVGLHLARLGAQVTLLDFSQSALLQAEQMYALEGLRPKTIAADVTHPDLHLVDKFDLIIDSHLLHCLTTDPERSSYLALVREHLTEQGVFVCETMVHRKKLFVPDGFMFDPNNVLWQMFGEWKPVRRILDSLDLEAEIKLAGLVINYFMYYANFSFIPHRKFMEIPSEVLPASVRMVLAKSVLVSQN